MTLCSVQVILLLEYSKAMKISLIQLNVMNQTYINFQGDEATLLPRDEEVLALQI